MVDSVSKFCVCLRVTVETYVATKSLECGIVGIALVTHGETFYTHPIALLVGRLSVECRTLKRQPKCCSSRCDNIAKYRGSGK